MEWVRTSPIRRSGGLPVVDDSRRSGQLYLVGISHTRQERLSAIRNVIAGLILARAAATCVTVDLEAGYSGRDLADIRTIADRRGGLYVALLISQVIANRARDV